MQCFDTNSLPSDEEKKPIAIPFLKPLKLPEPEARALVAMEVEGKNGKGIDISFLHPKQCRHLKAPYKLLAAA